VVALVIAPGRFQENTERVSFASKLASDVAAPAPVANRLRSTR
jgi:hypothetical protein